MALSGTLGTISTLMNSENRKLFEAGKIAAIANATISMYEGIMQAWKLGPILGPPLAVLVGAAGIANIQAIRNTQFGAGTAAVSNTQAINGASTPVRPIGPNPGSTDTGGNGGSVQIIINGAITPEMIDREVIPRI